MSPQRLIKKRIGEMLIERGILDERKLEIALKEQREKGGYISQHLVSLGFATELDIANCLASQYSFAYLPLEHYDIALPVLEAMPLKLIDTFSLLPVEKMGDTLSVAMADPLNDGVIDIIRQITGCNVVVFISTYSEIRKAIEKYFAHKLKELREEKEHGEDERLRSEFMKQFIQTAGYQGLERRRSKRVEAALDVDYFIQGRQINGKTKNLSLHGVLFVCSSSLPLEKNVYSDVVCKISLAESAINLALHIIRVEKIKEVGTDKDGASMNEYSVAGFITFIADDNQKKLTAFLNQKIDALKEA